MAGREPPMASPETPAHTALAKCITPTSNRRSLPALRDMMNSAQRTVLVARLAPADAVQLRTARVAQLLAMTKYEQALTGCHLPIPPRLRQETRLLRRLLG